MSRATRRLAAAALLSLAALPAMAQAPWPNQPIRLIVPFSAGVSDTIARLVSTEMSKSVGQPIVVENRAGAGGNIGSRGLRPGAAGWPYLLPRHHQQPRHQPGDLPEDAL